MSVRYSVVGTSVPRIEGRDKVTGAARFSADIKLPGLLRGSILRSPVPHARLLRIDTSRAQTLPGVRAIITGQDLGDVRTGNVVRDMPVLCVDRVRFIGDPIAAVAADDSDTAEAALDLIDVEYDELPAITDPMQAFQPDAVRIHPDVKSYTGAPEIPDVPNLQGYTLIDKGDLDAGLASAIRVFEHTFTTSPAHQGYLEQRACVVAIGESGTVDVWSSCKVPYKLRDLLASLAGLEQSQVVVKRVNIGGDFGAKGAIGPEPIIYFLAKAAGRPVLYPSSYTEEFQASNPRHPAVMRLRTGVDEQGRIVARELVMVLDGGAYGAHKITPRIDIPSVTRGLGPYRIPNARIECRIAYTNKVPGGIARAPGQPQVVFAGESQMDVIAAELGLDPIEFRLKNIIAKGEVWPAGEKFDGVMARETLEQARTASGWDKPLPPNRGRGVAITERGIPAAPSGVVLTGYDDGQVTVMSGIPDVGTGAFTILRQIVSEELQVPLAGVSVISGDTSEAPVDAGIGGSKSTFSMTAAAVQAIGEIKRTLAALAAEQLECSAEDLELAAGGFQVKGYPDSRIPTQDLIAQAARRAGAPIRSSSPGPGQQRATQSCSVACVAEVEVDPDTGQVRPIRLTMAHDVGTVINPQLLQAQIDGAAIQGVGLALMEQILTDGGQITTTNLGDYKLPTPMDIPDLVSVVVESPVEEGPAPFGAKAVGELANCPVPAAIANAVARASGARVADLPVSAERVRAAIADSARRAVSAT